MADDPQSPPEPVSEPYFEPIGPQSTGWLPEQDDDGARPRGEGLRAAVQAAAADWRRALGSLRFWSVALGTCCAAWVAVAALVWLPAGADAAGWLPAPVLTYMLALLLLPSAAALVAVHWGMAAYRRLAGWRALPGVPAPAGLDTSAPAPGLFAAVLAAGMRGPVFGLIVLASLLVQSAVAAQPGTLAAVAAVLAAAEGFLFGALGAAVAALVRNAAGGAVLGWFLALFLVAGSVAAGALLVPAVRSEEPVTVALNMQRAPDGTLLAYECSRVGAGTSEVYRTERIMWLPAASPGVIFAMLAGEQAAGKDLFGWLSSALQEAADGTQVPCVNGEPRSKDAPRMPMAATGLLAQAAVAGVFLAGAHIVSSRRRAAP